MKDAVGKLALGTVQFGLDYGISNEGGQVPPEEVREILQTARSNGVSVLDTAHAYGNSETVLGQCLRQLRSWKPKIVNKFPLGERPAMATIMGESLERLGQERLYGYLFHSLDSYRLQPERWAEMTALREADRVEKIGFSLYQPEDAVELLEKGLDIDLVQVPFSVLDQRWAEVWPVLKSSGVEVHVRSVFLQGLVFRDPAGLDAHFRGALASLRRLHEISGESGLPVAALCLGFALAQSAIDQVVMGVANLAQFRENLRLAEMSPQVLPWLPALSELALQDERILLPMFWPPTR